MLFYEGLILEVLTKYIFSFYRHVILSCISLNEKDEEDI